VIQIEEHPVSFNGQMVREIIADRKTQSRRIVRGNPAQVIPCPYTATGWSTAYADDHEGIGGACHCKQIRCPFGWPGDRLRISEEVTVKPVEGETDRFSVLFHADRSYVERHGDPALMVRIRNYKTGHLRGVHLPPAFARDLRLTVVRVRVERLQDISEEDAKAEGVERGPLDPWDRTAFIRLWESINGPDSWDANPWCWVAEFRRE
jgi:hypothetical protein